MIEIKTDKHIAIAFKYAREVTKSYAKSFYFANKLLPKEKQWETYGIYAYCRYVDNIVDRNRNRTASQLVDEIEYVREELKIAYKSGESEHPALTAFVHVAMKKNIPLKYPNYLIDGVLMDLRKNRYKNFDELYKYCFGVASSVGLMMSYVLGISDVKALKYAEKLGVGMQLTNILRDIKEDAEDDRIYLPLNELEEYGLSEEDILLNKYSEKFKQFVDYQIDRANKYYNEAQYGIKMLDKDSRFAIYAASKIYQSIHNKINEVENNSFLGRVYVTRFEKILILFNEYIRNKL